MWEMGMGHCEKKEFCGCEKKEEKGKILFKIIGLLLGRGMFW